MDEEHLSYLEGILRVRERQVGTYSIQFLFDPDGTIHARGKTFVLDVRKRSCYLRFARAQDVEDYGRRKIGPADRAGPEGDELDGQHEMRGDGEVRIGKPVGDIGAEELRTAVLSLLASEVMYG